MPFLKVYLSLKKITQSRFEFVHDESKHSWDYMLDPVTCKTSDILKYGTGFCDAKSHFLAALLRANNIPTGLCYQRLAITDVPPFRLYGLNAVCLEPFGWHRIDARGNKKGVSADFCPPIEKLAFPTLIDGEAGLSEICIEPLSVVVQALSQNKTIQDVSDNLPDIHLITAD